MCIKQCMSTVLIQISEGRIFRGCLKFSIFTILFSRITFLILYMIMQAQKMKFQEKNFRGMHIICKNSEIYALENFYEYSIAIGR